MEPFIRDAYITLREPVDGSQEQRKRKEVARKFVRNFWDQPNSKEVIMRVLEDLDKPFV